MSRFAENTTVPSDRSRTEIEKTLSRYGALISFHGQSNGCWEWVGHVNPHGYGMASTGKFTNSPAHRVIYTAFRGLIPAGLDLDHLCRNRCCVNPSHLEPVTRRENVMRGQNVRVLAHHAGTCIRHHKMNCENTYISPKGQRQCKQCRKMRELKRPSRAKQSRVT